MKVSKWISTHFFSFILAFIIFSTEMFISAAPQCSEIDRAAMLSFKASIIKDTTGILSTWTVQDCCSGAWDGVTCNVKTGRVTGLQIQRSSQDASSYMKGTLSSSLGNLQFLEVLIISGMKQIAGTIPESFSNLTRLTQLYIEDNSLHGTIPSSIGFLHSLKYLSLSGNKLQGNLPPSLGSMKTLIQLTLSRNLLSGPLKPAFRNPLLQVLDLSFNTFSGAITSSIFQFSKNLAYIDLSHNQFLGEIPASLCFLPSISTIDLSRNNFTGKIPSLIGNLNSLQTLSLASNFLNGALPESVARLEKLWLLNVSRNGLSDPLPSSLANGLPSLSSIDLSYNNFHLGEVPNWLLAKSLSSVSLAGCNIKGNLPVFTRPDILANVELSDNLLAGNVNQFLANKTSLQSIKLSNNMLGSNISEIGFPDTLSFFDISNNEVYGELPEFNEGLNLKSIILSKNHISGNIPKTISMLNSLERLDISRNEIKGSIPETMGQMKSLEWLDLSNNKLTGMIPQSFTKLVEVRHVNFRGNRLCGEIPQGRPFNMFTSKAYAHNLCLCGKPLPPCKTK